LHHKARALSQDVGILRRDVGCKHYTSLEMTNREVGNGPQHDVLLHGLEQVHDLIDEALRGHALLLHQQLQQVAQGPLDAGRLVVRLRVARAVD
jgi:hypothetical protein